MYFSWTEEVESLKLYGGIIGVDNVERLELNDRPWAMAGSAELQKA